jgi:hypothetical protein
MVFAPYPTVRRHPMDVPDEPETAEFRLLDPVGGPRHSAGPRRRWIFVAAAVVALLVAVLALVVPGYLAGQVKSRVADQVACPGVLARPPEVTVGGGWVVPQVLRGRFSSIQVAVPDVTLSGAPHASFAATMRDVRPPSGGSTRVGSFDGTITVGYRNLPAPKGSSFARASDGSLTVRMVVPADASEDVRAKLFLSMRLNGETAESVPSRLEIFGKTLPASQVGDLTGGVRKQQLPHLPDGVTYRSIAPRADGVHVSLAGVATTPLNTLPTQVGGHDVTYAAADGLLGINTSIGLKPIVDVPLTIRTRPVLSGRTLTLRPAAVHVLGADHDPGDPLGRLVLSQIKSADLARALPALPSGVSYQSVAVDAGGIRLTIGGTTVKPFSSLPQDAERPATFGAENGFLTATAKGGSGDDTPVVLHSKPVIHGRTLDIAPSEIEMFGSRFPASEVLAEVKGQQTAYPLQALPTGLAYAAGVSVLPAGLLIHVTGHDADLPRGSLTGGGC